MFMVGFGILMVVVWKFVRLIGWVLLLKLLCREVGYVGFVVFCF